MKDTAQIFKALSDETRLRLVNLLQTGGELCVCDLMAVLDLPQSTVSRHLAYLRNGGLVDDRRQGIWMYYRLRDSGQFIAKILTTLADQFNTANTTAHDRQRLSDYLASKNPAACDK